MFLGKGLYNLLRFSAQVLIDKSKLNLPLPKPVGIIKFLYFLPAKLDLKPDDKLNGLILLTSLVLFSLWLNPEP